MVRKKVIRRETILFCAAIAAFFLLIALQNIIHDPAGSAQGIIAQFQVMVSLYMVIAHGRKGCIAAIIGNSLQSVQVGIYILLSNNMKALPGTVVPLTTIFIVCLLYYYISNLNQKMAVSLSQQEILTKNAIELNRLAYYDQLTGTLNRESIIRELDVLCRMAIEKGSAFSLVFIDMDDFKDINDTMGHQVGDELLKAISERFGMIKHQEDLLGRLGGDEFALVIKRSLSDREIYHTLFEYKDALRKVELTDHKVLEVSASFGVALAPKDASNAMDLIKYADTAMYKAKGQGKDRIQFFSHEMKEELTRKVEMERLMLGALENRELHLAFQPVYDISSRRLRSLEALARWQSPLLGPVSPAQFIPLAESNGLISSWGSFLMEEACRQFVAARPHFQEGIGLSVNLSPKQIMEPHFVNLVRKILERTGMPAKLLELEITESLFIADVEEALTVLHGLKGLGVRLALDDFGTGYSSLYLLQQLPIDTLKIDKACVDPLTSEEKTRTVVSTIIRLAHEMGISAIAEGVETEDQLVFLREHGCDCLQGYLWGKPMALEDVLGRAGLDAGAEEPKSNHG